jgi:hypothetical protein
MQLRMFIVVLVVLAYPAMHFGSDGRAVPWSKGEEPTFHRRIQDARSR